MSTSDVTAQAHVSHIGSRAFDSGSSRATRLSGTEVWTAANKFEYHTRPPGLDKPVGGQIGFLGTPRDLLPIAFKL